MLTFINIGGTSLVSLTEKNYNYLTLKERKWEEMVKKNLINILSVINLTSYC